jgi:hypothetical protein
MAEGSEQFAVVIDDQQGGPGTHGEILFPLQAIFASKELGLLSHYADGVTPTA